MGKKTAHVIHIDKDTVRSKDVDKMSRVLKTLERDPAATAQSIIIGFEYDDVPEEVYQIEEVREWVRLLMEKHPYFFFYVNTEADTDGVLIYCLCAEVTVAFKGEYISQDEYVRKYGKLDNITTRIELRGDVVGSLNTIIDQAVMYADRLGVPEVGRKIASNIVDKWRARLFPGREAGR